MVLSPENDGVENTGDEQGNGQGLIPMEADDALYVKQMFEGEIHYRNEDDMEADNDQCTDG